MIRLRLRDIEEKIVKGSTYIRINSMALISLIERFYNNSDISYCLKIINLVQAIKWVEMDC